MRKLIRHIFIICILLTTLTSMSAYASSKPASLKQSTYSSTKKAYDEAMNLTVAKTNKSRSYNSAGVKYNGLYIHNADDIKWAASSWNTKKTWEHGTLYRAMADAVEYYYEASSFEDWCNLYQDSLPIILGLAKNAKKDDVRSAMEDVKEILTNSDPGLAFLSCVTALDCVDGEFPNEDGAYEFTANTKDLAKALHLTDVGLGYTLAMMTEYLGETTFTGNKVHFVIDNPWLIETLVNPDYEGVQGFY